MKYDIMYKSDKTKLCICNKIGGEVTKKKMRPIM
jgi:hypothetical protein